MDENTHLIQRRRPTNDFMQKYFALTHPISMIFIGLILTANTLYIVSNYKDIKLYAGYIWLYIRCIHMLYTMINKMLGIPVNLKFYPSIFFITELTGFVFAIKYGSDGTSTYVFLMITMLLVWDALILVFYWLYLANTQVPQAVRQVPLATFAVIIVAKDENANCTICLDEYKDGENIKMLICKHRFHALCIEPWLDIHTSCPLCRVNSV